MNKIKHFTFLFIAAMLPLALPQSLIAEDAVGPIVGAVEADSAQLLFRPAFHAEANEQVLRLTLFSSEGDATQTVEAKCNKEHDYVAKFALQGLTPNTTYRYQIESTTEGGKIIIPADEAHAFTTVNLAREDHSVTLGFVSCADLKPNPMWREMKNLKIDALCLMGDTPYIDTSDLTSIRAKHRAFLQHPGVAAIGKTTSIVGVWDDHDFGKNNGNGLNMLKGKVNTRRGFVEYRANSQFGNGTEGVYHKADHGMIEVFLLDPRYFSQCEKSPVDPTQTTCFGADQWDWLLKSLKASKAPFKVLSFGAIWQDKKNSETDDMFTYWYERDALLDFVKREKIGGVVLLGGDIHVARHLMHPQRVGYNLHDFIISPGHTRTIAELDVYHPSLEWSLVEGQQFLTLTADGTGEEPKLIARYRQAGKVNATVKIPLSAMQVKDDKSSNLRAHWTFDEDFGNLSILGKRIDAQPKNGAELVKAVEDAKGVVRLRREDSQFLNIPRSFLDDQSRSHAVTIRFKAASLPGHGTADRHFLFESTAEGTPSKKQAWHLSLGMRASSDPEKVNLQIYTETLKPAAVAQAAPSEISQGPFDTLIDRKLLENRWCEAKLTFDGNRFKLFLNGELVGDHPLPIPGPAAEFGGLIIGGHREGVGRNFDGWIDEISIAD